ncbi:sulfotransferase family protein [Streptomyces sp. DT171]|uniref:sulfotransferase family protein n=1 Tax=Streptomyces sp. DT171 TaxID=3416524 RepID=UPI003CE9938C
MAVRRRSRAGGGALDPDELLADAGAAVGAVARTRFRPAFERLVESLNSEAGLSERGVAAARRRLLAALEQQELIGRLGRRHPEIRGMDVVAPVFVTGLPGSGAALLQNLLVEHPGLDGPALWELSSPAAQLSHPGRRRSFIDRTRLRAEDARRPVAGRGVGQLTGATRPGGCHRLLENAFQSPMLSVPWRVPGYAAWLETRDLMDAYDFHREQLRAVTWRIPGSTLVLRDPFHSRHLHALVRSYPDARVVRLHRGPADVVSASAGISAARRAQVSAAVNPVEVGREWVSRVERHFAASEAARAAVPGERVLDVRFEELVAEPVRVVRRVLRFAGVTPIASVDRHVAELAGRVGNGLRRARPFQPGEFGLSRRQLDARFAVYRAMYGV